jgi:hypothetical protein
MIEWLIRFLQADPQTILALPVLIGMLLTTVALSYVRGPGLLSHHPCPHCCWCTGRRPWFDRAIDRLKERILEPLSNDDVQ